MPTAEQVKRFVENHYSNEMLVALSAAIDKGDRCIWPTESLEDEVPHSLLIPIVSAETKRRGLI